MSYFDELIPIIEQLKAESDRALVLITAALVENELVKHLELRLLEKIERNDELLHRADFELKVILAYRSGVITKNEHDVYQQLRKLRNKCAHDATDQSFDKDHFKARMKNIIEKSPEVWNALKKDFDSIDAYLEHTGWRESFILFFGMIIMHKRKSYNKVIKVKSLSGRT
ncbi:hypothetical protein L4C39_00510 [Vibrio clamense]|uniref:hypothetical protein n=1 Tax=Vibrio clamense TaxID=2910254 RepID=UPI003D1A27F2